MVALGSHRSRGGLGQAGIGLQGFVKHFHLPPFFVGRDCSVIVARQVAAHQMQYPGTVVFVFKDCSGQVISDGLIGFFDVDSRSKALGDKLPSFE